MTSQLLTPQEVADPLNVPVSWVYKRTEKRVPEPDPAHQVREVSPASSARPWIGMCVHTWSDAGKEA